MAEVGNPSSANLRIKPPPGDNDDGYEMQDLQRRDDSKEPGSINFSRFDTNAVDCRRISLLMVLGTRHHSFSDRSLFDCVGDGWTRLLVQNLQEVQHFLK